MRYQITQWKSRHQYQLPSLLTLVIFSLGRKSIWKAVGWIGLTLRLTLILTPLLALPTTFVAKQVTPFNPPCTLHRPC